MTVELRQGDSREVVAAMPDCSIDAVVTDPPYALVSIVKRFGKPGAAPAKEGSDGVYKRASAGFMGQQWDTGEVVHDVAFWAQIYRVLKPGGHMVAFAGTRTYHRMTCAIEDAGFEIRDMVAWLYGTGFPKSHDVSKAIDKAAGAEREKVRVDAAEVRNQKATGGGKDGTAGATRPWIEEALVKGYHEKDGGIPATDAARQWEGWGTALKPALEPIVMARKPLMTNPIDVRRLVETRLRERGVGGEIKWRQESASVAERSRRTPNSSLTAAPQVAEISVENAAGNGTARTEKPTESYFGNGCAIGATETLDDKERIPESTTENCVPKCLPHMGAPALVVEKPNHASSPSATSMAVEQRIGEEFTGKSIPSLDDKATHPGIESFAGIVTGLTGLAAIVHIKRDNDGMLIWPHGLPEYVPGKSLTVAQNVLQHGTGALNIDGCRIGNEEITTAAKEQVSSPLNNQGTTGWAGCAESTHVERWPANIVHDGSDEVLDGFPDSDARPPGSVIKKASAAGYQGNALGAESRPAGSIMLTHGDSGSVARFFYSAKADKLDRWGSRHPTVKPVDLMRWLARLITPPGGTILDPFAGSGTTGVAALAEGFNCILIEREAQFAADIEERLAFYRGEGRHSMVSRNRSKPSGVGALRDGGRLTEAADKRGTMPLFAEPKS